jgi:hypothetical protein
VKKLNEDIPEDLMTPLLHGRALGQAPDFISSHAASGAGITKSGQLWLGLRFWRTARLSHAPA